MRRLLALPLFIAVVLLGVWLISAPHEVRHAFEGYFQKEEFVTLDKRFSPHEIMDDHKHELLRLEGSAYQEPTTVYYPFLLLNVSYEKGKKGPQDAVILVSLQDGSVVINPLTWELAGDAMAGWPQSEPLIAWTYEGGTKAPTRLALEEAVAQAEKRGLMVRNSRLVYLPVYHLDIKNLDDSTRQTRWNAFSGTEF